MKSKLLSVLAALTLLVGALAAPTSVAAAGGLCAGTQWPAGETGQYYFQRSTGFYYDDLYGWVTDRPLWPCEGLANQGWSFTAAVNLQDTGGHIWQLGILQEGGNGGDQNYFVYTAANGSGVYTKITSPRPTAGTRYRFRLFKNSAGHVSYNIVPSGGSVIWSWDTGYAWDSTMNFAWWGWESANSRTAPGLCSGCSRADLVGQYSLAGDAAIYTRTSITPLSHVPAGCSPPTWLYVSGTNYEVFNVDSTSGCPA